MDRDVVTGAVGVEQVEFVVTPEKVGRTTRWRLTCACGDSGLAANRVQAGKAAAVHAHTMHGGARARVVIGGQDARAMTVAVNPRA